ncbi:MAG: GerAB/ArcD/ProY family transporter [Nanoarchaeota archaeon]|nr:GerAB/ArcD/ProY family transporter [Nanoarchaeota archaeon]MBU1321737.1 GerAB/ArcD/ProY family transporter [Nanoarchaeota archaeon]MBU1597703.1 GerAB/ArcD/ProY family transporter [Nanoarchaeota archaeon]MBU2442295.1 GerAB/ArcD/ProY family transporter [Nanoarchaeota archaeon]
MSKKRLFIAVSTMVGCVIGAGILGIPYVIAKAGFLTGLINIVGIGLIIMLLHLYLGEVILRTKGKHQLTGYAEKYTGKIGKYFMFISMILLIYGALIAYTLGGGEALASILGWDVLLCSIIFFGILSWLIYIGLNAIEKSEAFVMPVIIIIVLLIFFLALPRINLINLSGLSFSKLLLPYGVVLFSFLGSAAIPEMKEELEKNKKQLKKAIIIGCTIPIIIYILFAFGIVGVLGSETHEIGALGLASILGEKMVFIGAIFALLTLATSFLALGLALKELFWYDYKLRKNTSWLLACFVPFILFLLIKVFHIASFVTILNITGIVSGTIIGILTVFMVFNAKKKGNRKPEYTIYINKFIGVLLILFYLIGAINLLI